MSVLVAWFEIARTARTERIAMRNFGKMICIAFVSCRLERTKWEQ